tara:strand:+ start:24845 stop:27010 length:2166 start_codon:yes stop_codon:yes gene_type:complete
MSSEEIIQILQSVVDEGKEDRLNENGRFQLDAARRVGLIKDNRNIIRRTFDPQREDIGEFPASLRLSSDPTMALEQIRDMAVDKRMPLFSEYADAVLETDKYGNAIIASPSTGNRSYINTPSFTLQDIPRVISGTMDVVEEVAPYLSGAVATKVAKPVVQTLVEGGVGFGSEAVNQAGLAMRGEETDLTRLVTTPALAMAGDIAGRTIFKIGANVYNRFAKKSAAPAAIMNKDGEFTKEAIAEMGTTPAKIDEAVIDDLIDAAPKATPTEAQAIAARLAEKQTQGKMTERQLKRYNILVRAGLKPTKAQVSRSADDFQAQSELSKTTTGTREALEEQEAILTESFNNRILKMEGDLSQSGAAVSEAVVNRGIALDNEVTQIYKEIDAQLPNSPVISLDGFLGALRRLMPEDQLTGGVVKPILAFAESMGAGKNKLITARDAEKIRQYIVQLQGANLNGQGQRVVRQLKQALDNNVTKSAGQDFYERARKAKTEFHKGLSTEARDKFDLNQNSLVGDIFSNTINPDDVFKKVVLGTKWKAKDLLELKSYLLDGSADQIKIGTKAWNNLRRDTLNFIKEKVFIGPEDSMGYATMSKTALKSVLDRIDRKTLEVLFSKPEMEFLDLMVKVSKIREPVRFTGGGLGPSAQAIKFAVDRIENIPILGAGFKSIRLNRETGKMVNAAPRLEENVRKIQSDRLPLTPRPRQAAARGIGSATATQIGEE